MIRLIVAMLLAASMNCTVQPAVVVETYDNIVLVDTGSDIFEYYGDTDYDFVYLVMNGNEILDAI